MSKKMLEDVDNFNSLVMELYPKKEKYTSVHFEFKVCPGDIVTFNKNTPENTYWKHCEICSSCGFIESTKEAKAKQWKVKDIICLVDENGECQSYVNFLSALKSPTNQHGMGWAKMVNTKYLDVVQSAYDRQCFADVIYPYPIGTKYYEGILDYGSSNTINWSRKEIRRFKMIATQEKFHFLMEVNKSKYWDNEFTYSWWDSYLFSYTSKNNRTICGRAIIPFDEIRDFITPDMYYMYIPPKKDISDYNMTKLLLNDMGFADVEEFEKIAIENHKKMSEIVKKRMVDLSPLEKFERLLPCNEDGDVTTENGIDYIPKLYKFREKWFVEWKDKSFYNKDINKAIDKAYQWAKEHGLVKED